MEDQLRLLPYRDLQQLAKQRNLRANRKRDDLIVSVAKALRDKGETEETLEIMLRRIDPKRAPPQPRHEYALRESHDSTTHASPTTNIFSRNFRSMNGSHATATNRGKVAPHFFNVGGGERRQFSLSRGHPASIGPHASGSTPMITHQPCKHWYRPNPYQNYNNNLYRQPPAPVYQPDKWCYPSSWYNTESIEQHTTDHHFNVSAQITLNHSAPPSQVLPYKAPKITLDQKYAWADDIKDNSIFGLETNSVDDIFKANGLDDFFSSPTTEKLYSFFDF